MKSNLLRLAYPSDVKTLLALLFATVLLPAQTLRAGEVTLAWDPSVDPVSSYKVYRGTISGIYTDVVNVGMDTSATVTGLTEGTTYFFVATAVGTNSLESDFSNEISHTIPNAANQPPTITSVSDQITDEDTPTSPISVTVDDPDDVAGTLTLSGVSSNPALVPNANIVFGGSGSARTITVTPLADASGSTLITVTVSDGEDSATTAFNLTVNSVNDAPSITAILGQTVAEDTVAGPITFSVDDIETPAADLTLTGSSSDPSLVPDANIVFGGSGSSRSVNVTPLADATGTAQITIAVSDGNLSTSRVFTLTVTAVNDLPTITSIADQSVPEDTVVGPLDFSVGDLETAPRNLVVSGTSGNLALVPDENIQFGGSFASRTVTITPAANQSGTALITLSVTDGADSATTAFLLTVVTTNDAPTITSIGNQTINEDAVAGPISFTVADSDTDTAALTLSGTSSDPSLVPNANITFAGSGPNRAVTVTPLADMNGSADITVTVNDGDLTASSTFSVVVNSVNDAPTLAALSDVNVAQDSGSQTVNLAGIGTGAANETQTLSVAAVSSDPTIVPNPTPNYTSPQATGSLELTPATGKSGTVVVTVTVTDSGTTANGGANSVQQSFTVNVTPPENTPPTLTTLGNVAIDEDAVAGPIGFSVGDAESGADGLTLTGSSSNPGLVPSANITFGGSGASRTVTVTPVADASGSAQITVAVSDGTLSATRQFTLTVNNVNDVPTVTSIGNVTVDEDTATGPLAFVVGDVETSVGNLVLSATSSNPGLVPEANITFGGSGADRAVNVSPAANQSGTAQITVTVSDGTDSITSAFTLTVDPVNDAPTVSAIAAQTTDEDTAAGPIAFVVGDVETSAGSLTVSGQSSNTTLVPNANIVFSGSGANRAVTLTPAPNQFGTAQITVTVGDGELEATRTFTLTVNSVEDPPTAPSNLRVAQVSVQ